jgi:hypothetical protein
MFLSSDECDTRTKVQHQKSNGNQTPNEVGMAM